MDAREGESAARDRTIVERVSDREAVVTRTFDASARKVFEAWRTLLVMSELYPSKEALDEAGTGEADATHETFGQLDELLVTLH